VRIDLLALQQAGYLVPTQSRSRLAEEFRQIKRPLLRNAHAEGAAQARQSLVMVTSALPSEGKTFFSINLAMSLAMEVDSSVLLVDADVVRPNLLSRLGIEARKGLLDLLTEERLALADVVVKTNVPKLSLLAAGSPSSRATELLASAAMDRLLTELVTRWHDRIVVFDSPPLLPTTEARVLASNLGQVVMVVEAARTPRKVVEQAFAAVAGCPVVMSVLNKCSEASRSHRYGDYYG